MSELHAEAQQINTMTNSQLARWVKVLNYSKHCMDFQNNFYFFVSTYHKAHAKHITKIMQKSRKTFVLPQDISSAHRQNMTHGKQTTDSSNLKALQSAFKHKALLNISFVD